MNLPTLEAVARDLKGRKNHRIRSEGRVPAIVYGAGLKQPKNIAIDRNAFVRVFKQTGESTLVDLSIDGKEHVNVLIQDIQLDPLRDEVIHADFRAVDMNKPIEARVKLEFTGESGAVKNLGGTLVKSQTELTIRALPKDLVSSLAIDLSSLKTFDDTIHVRDIAASAGVEILEKPDLTIVTVMEPRSEAEMAALESAVDLDVTKIEVAKKGKEEEEGEAAAEGAAAPAAGGEEKKAEKKPAEKK